LFEHDLFGKPVSTRRVVARGHAFPDHAPVLNGLADECCGMLAHLVAHVGALALLAIAGIHLWDESPADAAVAVAPSASAGWGVALRSHPAFAVSQFDLPEKTETYQILRHPEGGRKAILR
jgi:hypothetical protein